MMPSAEENSWRFGDLQNENYQKVIKMNYQRKIIHVCLCNFFARPLYESSHWDPDAPPPEIIRQRLNNLLIDKI